MIKQEVIDKVVGWAKGQEEIKVVTLTGSLAGKGPVDELSDYDIAIFTSDTKKYLSDDNWLNSFGKVLVYEPCDYKKFGGNYQTKLVVYEDGLQIDFAIFDLNALDYLLKSEILPVEYNLGYKVLLDKEGLLKNLKLADYVYPYSSKPTEQEFDLAVRIFLFESFKAAKALARNDLFHAKLRDWTTKEYLIRMIEWYMKAKNGWNYDTNYDAKRMGDWVEPWIWQGLQKTFSRFDKQDSFAALIATVNLFGKIAESISSALEYDYQAKKQDDLLNLANSSCKCNSNFF